MMIGKSSPTISNLEIDKETIKRTDKLKLLGVTIDERLNFSDHISATCKKTSKLIGVLMRLRKLIPTEAKLQIYKTAILPYLTYCSLAWHFCKATDKKLERVNERGLRAVYCNWKLPYEDLLKRAKMNSLYQKRLQDIVIFMFKVKHKLLPKNILNLFNNSLSSYNLRNADFHIPSFKTVRHGKHSLRYFGPVLWSKLTFEERNIESLRSFKSAIQKRDLTDLVESEQCTNCHLCHN